MNLDRICKYIDRQEDMDQRPLVADDLGGVAQVVVIPALAEERSLFATLASLAANQQTELDRTLVVCVVNNRNRPHNNPGEIEDNQRTLKHLCALVNGESAETKPGIEPGSLRLAFVDASSPGCELGARQGVGAARRIGLDHAAAVLADNRVAGGLLISLDADSTVSKGYLAALRAHFETAGSWAAVVDYEHPLPVEPVAREAIVSYELFLRYHVLGLRWARSPYAYHAIGSTIVCRLDAYAAIGGMNRRQAGEDFYFLQQLAKTGGVERIRGVTVYPSPRPSRRVPFGTGAAVGRLLDEGSAGYRIYHPEIYGVLGTWLRAVEGELSLSASELLSRAQEIAVPLHGYLEASGFRDVWPRLVSNAPDEEQLKAQFHRWFDAFRTLKMIHHLRDHGLAQTTLVEAFERLVNLTGLEWPGVDWQGARTELDAKVELLNVARGVV